MTAFMHREFAVEDPDKTTTIRQDAPASRPQAPGGGILYIIGLPGSGMTSVAEHLGRELGLPAHKLPLNGADEALTGLLAGGPAVIEVPHKLLTAPAFRQRLAATGRVLYLMANVEAIAARLNLSSGERERLGRQRTSYEPLFLQTLQLIAPADGPLAEILADVLERVRM